MQETKTETGGRGREMGGKGGSAKEGRHGWRRVLTPVTVAILLLAGFLLYRTLSQYSFGELVASVSSVPLWRLGTAGLFAAASYLCLTASDALAVRYAGHALPYHRTAVTSLIALSIGHNIGFAFLSSGAIRYRFYSRWGLGAGDIAKVILFCGLTIGVGLVVLGGAGALLRPELAAKITGMSRPLVFAVGLACMAVAAVYLLLAAFVRRPLRFRRWSLEMPSLRLALGQMAVGTVNFVFVAACLHQAVNAVAEVPYFSTVIAYVIANVGVMMSHVPGGLGVLETVLMFLLPQTDLIGALLVFRFVYYLVPLAIGGTVFALSEVVLRGSRESTAESS